MSTIVVSRTTTVRRAPKKASSATQDVKPPRKARKAPAPGIMKPLKGVTEEMLAKHPISTFQNTVYALTLRIPPGYVTTYGAMAKVLNSSPRAVGQALRHNPFAPTVPCHRVIAQTGLGGFHGAIDGVQLDRKIKLLRSEGVTLMEDTKLTDDALNFTSAIINDKSVLTAEEFEEKLKQQSKGFDFAESSIVKSESSAPIKSL